MSSTSRGGKRSPADFYATPAWPVKRLLERVELPAGGWIEPMAGNGAIINAVNEVRDDVTWFAIEKRKSCEPALREAIGKTGRKGRFLSYTIADLFKIRSAKCEVTITNPAFSIAMAAIQHTLPFSPYVIHLLRLNFLGTELRNDFFKSNMPDVYVIPDRVSFAISISCMRNKKGCTFAKIVGLNARVPKACPKCGAKLRVSTTDSIEYAWFVFGPERGRRTGRIEVLDHTPMEERK